MITRKVAPIKAVLIACLFGSLAVAQSTSATGGVQISITDEHSQVIPNAVVQYRRIPRTTLVTSTRAVSEMPAPGEAIVGGTVVADQNGRIGLQSLPAGNYMLCATVPSAAYLDPCIWEQPISVTVSANSTTSQQLVLTKGVLLNVRVNDPLGILPHVKDGIWTPRRLLIGVVYANGAYQGVANTNVDATGRDYQLIIPAGVPLTLRIFSNHVAITDQTGSSVDISGSQIPFEATVGQDTTFSFAVSGVLKEASPQ